MFAAYVLLMVWYFAMRPTIWQWSVYSSEVLSALPEKWYYWFWPFSNTLYEWFGWLPALLLLFAPRKDSMMRSVFVMVLSFVYRNYMRAIVKEKRPLFEDNRIVLLTSCNCSFGFPSGHSEGSCIMYTMAVYELLV